MNKDSEKLIIQTSKYGGDSKVVSVRLPEEMLSEIDGIASTASKSRNEIVLMCLEYALPNVQVKQGGQ